MIRDMVNVDGCVEGALARLQDRFVFFDSESILDEDEDFLVLDAHKSFDIMMSQVDNKINCMSSKMSDNPVKLKRVSVNKKFILEILSIDADSFIYQSVVQARSGLIVPGNGKSNGKGLKLV